MSALKQLTAAIITALTTTAMMTSAGYASEDESRDHDREIRHVLLLSIDGLHALDLKNFVAAHPDSALSVLSHTGITYTNASTMKPSDSFPGLLAQVTGGSPKSTGVFYDDSYDRKLSAPGDIACATQGTETHFAENIDYDSTAIDGGASQHNGQMINPAQLPRDGARGCVPVYPHQFLRVNTIFEVVKAHGGRTAWADKHPAYDIVKGPSGHGVDDLYTPEIDANATVANGFPVSLATGQAITKSVAATEFYDGLKVSAVVNEINGFDHSGAQRVGTPTVFGMNFQAVSVGQKLAGNGYLDPIGTPSAGLADALTHTDQSVRKMIDALRARHLLESTLIIVSAKHGQSPIDPNKRMAIDDGAVFPTALGSNLAFDIADDGALIWLHDQTQTAAGLMVLDNTPNSGIGELLAGPALALGYQDPATDSRTPDIIAIANTGVVYTTGSKIAEHGGFNEDDTHVALLLSHPDMKATTINSPVQTTQIAPTILRTLDINPAELQAVRMEKTPALPQ